MAPRTRATATTVPAAAPLAAAPRRRLKVTPLEKEKPLEPEPKAATRSTRAKNTSITDEKPATRTAKTKSTNTAAPQTRGRATKTEPTAEETEAEKPAEKPKRATRATRATATTVSSEAKEKKTPTTKTTRSGKPVAKDKPVEKAEPEPVHQSETIEVALPTKAATSKKVTFQDIIENDKENQPITRAGKKTTTSKNAEQATGLRAKPVRKPTATTTRASKRTKAQTSDDEDDKPKKIQRVLTPKKITQVARAATPEEESEDELNSGKTPVRDLSLSPRRPQTTLTAEAIAKTLSPAKKLDFSQSLVQQSAPENAEPGACSMMSPARRPPTSPAKLFYHSVIASPVKTSTAVGNALASPARRPADSPAKLIFPHPTKNDQRVHPHSQTSNNIHQSPKRSTAFDPARMFAQSAIKPQKTPNNLSKSSFFSSPAKRAGLSSPLKQSGSRHQVAVNTTDANDELDLDDVEISELVHHEPVEISVSSHQRASVSPTRTYKLSADELQDDFDDSILPVRSPLKIAKSPVKMTLFHEEQRSAIPEQDEHLTEALSSVQSTPRSTTQVESTFVSMHELHANKTAEEEDLEHELDMADIEDDTIILPENVEVATPQNLAASFNPDTSMDELAPSPREDLIAKFIRTPGPAHGTPASVHEHELTRMLSSPQTQSMPVASPPREVEIETAAKSPAGLDQYRSTMVLSSAEPVQTPVPVTVQVESSPACLYENELTTMGGTPKHAITSEEAFGDMGDTPASLHENELTMIGGTPAIAVTTARSIGEPGSSPISLAEYQLTRMAGSRTPKAAASPASVAEGELTMMGRETPSHARTPASLTEHELTMMAETSPGKNVSEDKGQTPITGPVRFDTFTPDLPMPRKFNCHTVISKVPLKPEAEESPFKFQIKKRKRHSLGDEPLLSFDSTARITPVKSARTVSSPEATSARNTPAQGTSQKTPTSKLSSVKSARRVASTLASRTPLTPVASESSKVLSNATVLVDVRTLEGVDASAIYIDLLSSLGAYITKSFDDSLTHVVFKDGNPRVLDKARLSQSDIKVVGVAWPLDCEAQKSWVDETEYLLNLTPTEQVLQSVTKSTKRKSMEPSMLVADGTGSIKRSRSKSLSRMSIGSVRRSAVKPLSLNSNTPSPAAASDTEPPATSTPQQDPTKTQAQLEKNSLTAAWKSINAPQNLGEDTPARRTLELLQKSYNLDNNNGWDNSILTTSTNTGDENTPQPQPRHSFNDDVEAEDESLLETGLTPAPFRTQKTIGSAPSKLKDIGMMSYRERVEEMERREMRDNAFGTGLNKGTRGVGKAKKEGRRMTVFGAEDIR